MRQHPADLTSSDLTIVGGLHDLRDLSEMVAGSLTVKDVFRAVSSRICDLFFCNVTELWLLDENRTDLVRAARWEKADHSNEDAGSAEQLAKRCLWSKNILTEQPGDPHLPTSPGRMCYMAAVPLFRGDEVIGVLELFFNNDTPPGNATLPDLEMLGKLVSPVVMNSVIAERNRAKALTDTVTDLPNERAFYLILENCIAASQSDPGRALSILAIDIKDFAGINEAAGHSIGDVALREVARIARENLRTMDFIARSHNDEFLAILPTATDEITKEIISRIEHAIKGSHCGSYGEKWSQIQLSFGWAAFGKDGDTAGLLLSRARLRKNRAKISPGSHHVLPFPHLAVG